MKWDKLVYRFVLFSICIGIVATFIRWVLFWYRGDADLSERVGAPIAIVFEMFLAGVLWKKPSSLYRVCIAMYGLMIMGISSRLLYLLFSGLSNVIYELMLLTPWMFVSYLIPVFIMRLKHAAILVGITFLGWGIISMAYLVQSTSGVNQSGGLVIVIQTFFAQFILIIFLMLFARLQFYYTKERRSVMQLKQIAGTDFMLGIANRRTMHTVLTTGISAAESGETQVSVMLVDIDHFKQINDQYGHAVGDKILTEASELLRHELGDRGELGRWGGEEFLIVMSHDDPSDCIQCAEHLRSAVEKHHFQMGDITISIGLTHYRQGDTIDSLLGRADQALYQSKRNGRNRVEVIE